MSYAIRNDGMGWRAINDGSDVGIDEYFSADLPATTLAQQTAESWREFQTQAKAALDVSDITVLRCVEKSVAVPAEWANYRVSLRAIVGATAIGDPTQPLPTKPTYPAGT